MSATEKDSLYLQKRAGMLVWVRSGEPLIWANGAAVSISVIAVVGLILLLAVRGFGHFWPNDIMQSGVVYDGRESAQLGVLVEEKQVSGEQLRSAGMTLNGAGPFFNRMLFKQGNRDFLGSDFVWVLEEQLVDSHYPEWAMVVERLEWGNQYGFLHSVTVRGERVAEGEADTQTWQAFQQAIEDSLAVRDEIHRIERKVIGSINHNMEAVRLAERKLELAGNATPGALAELAERRAVLDAEYRVLQQKLAALYDSIQDDYYQIRLVDGRIVDQAIAKVVRATLPNQMSLLQKMGQYLAKLWEFLSTEPREANTEGGVFPAIFGTVMMVLLMSVMVTPFGVVAAVYLREYARQGLVPQLSMGYSVSVSLSTLWAVSLILCFSQRRCLALPLELRG